MNVTAECQGIKANVSISFPVKKSFNYLYLVIPLLVTIPFIVFLKLRKKEENVITWSLVSIKKNKDGTYTLRIAREGVKKTVRIDGKSYQQLKREKRLAKGKNVIIMKKSGGK
ncbi:MAG: hypothetical protein ACXQT5_06795 [Candidatus Syntropharchaeia archaeon]